MFKSRVGTLRREQEEFQSKLTLHVDVSNSEKKIKKLTTFHSRIFEFIRQISSVLITLYFSTVLGYISDQIS